MNVIVDITNSPGETERLGERLAESLYSGTVIALYGSMGMGKTAFVRGLARGLGCDAEEVSSPTFAIVHEYHGGRLPLFHFDMYRVTQADDLFSTGFFEYMEMGGVTVIEWSENIEGFLPEGTMKIRFERGDAEDCRRITGGIE